MSAPQESAMSTGITTGSTTDHSIGSTPGDAPKLSVGADESPDPRPDLAQLWSRTLERLTAQDELTPQFQAWLSLTRPIAFVEDTVLLAAPHDFAKDILETRLRPALTAALALEIGRDVRVAVTVEPSTAVAGSPDDGRQQAGDVGRRSGDEATGLHSSRHPDETRHVDDTHRGTDDTRREPVRVGVLDGARPIRHEAGDGRAQHQGSQLARDGLDLGKLGHGAESTGRYRQGSSASTSRSCRDRAGL